MRRSTGVGVTLLVGLALAIVAFLPAPVVADGDDGVVVSRPGVVFHKAGSSDIRGKGHGKSLSSALAAGYSPCKVCFGRQVSVDMRGAGAAGASATSRAMGGPPIIPPGHGTPVISQPFGLRIQPPHRGRGGAHSVHNPYSLVGISMRFPGPEQGAYGS